MQKISTMRTSGNNIFEGLSGGSLQCVLRFECSRRNRFGAHRGGKAMEIGKEWTFEHTIECSVSIDFACEFWTNVENWAVDADLESVELRGGFCSLLRAQCFGGGGWLCGALWCGSW